MRSDGKETKSIVQQMARETTVMMNLMENKVDEVMRPYSRNPNLSYSLVPKYLFPAVGQWRQDLRIWFSPPDPSTNHIILCNTQHQRTANWFFRGSLFEKWKSAGSLLWIHGKRTPSSPSTFPVPHSDATRLYSRLWEERPLVRRFSYIFISDRLMFLLAPQ